MPKRVRKAASTVLKVRDIVNKPTPGDGKEFKSATKRVAEFLMGSEVSPSEASSSSHCSDSDLMTSGSVSPLSRPSKEKPSKKEVAMMEIFSPPRVSKELKKKKEFRNYES